MGFRRLKVRSRIFIGFGALIVLSLAVAGFGVFQLSGVGGEATKMGGLARNTARVLDATRSLGELRRAELRIHFDGIARAINEGKDDSATTRKLLTDASQTRSEERRRALASVLATLTAHDEEYDRFVQLTKTML